MKTKILNIFIIILLVIITLLFFVLPNIVMDSVTFSISIWKDSLLPSLFPFFMISDLLINYGFIELIGELLKNIMSKLFHLPGEAAFVLIGSMLSGFPSSAKYISELLNSNKISKQEAIYLMKFNHFSNPLFVVGTVGSLLLNNKHIGVLILLIHIISNFIIALLFRPKTNPYQGSKISLKNAINKMHKKRTSNGLSFSEILSTSIFKSINTLILLLGIITTFIILNNMTNEIINLPPLLSSVLGGILEMTGGIKNISSFDISINIKSTVIAFFISFGGFSIHMQVMSILSSYNIKYTPYLMSRIIHGILTSSIVFMLTSTLQAP